MANDSLPLADVSNGQRGGGGLDLGRHQEVRGVLNSGLRRNYSWSFKPGSFGRGVIVPLVRRQNVQDLCRKS